MIKRIVCDLDGTLLNASHELDVETIQWIKRLQENGITFMPATGRPYDSIKKLFNDCPLYDELILLNGALITNNIGEPIQETPLEEAQIKAVMQVFEEYGFTYHMFTNKGLVLKDGERTIREFREQLLQEHKTEEEVEVMIQKGGLFDNMIALGDAKESFLANNPIVYKMETHGKDREKLVHIKEALKKISDIEITSSIGSNIEVTHVKAQKGIALMNLCESLSIRPNDVIVVGDSSNDLSMFKLFHNSVAMCNAIPDLKNLASLITKKTYKDLGIHEVFQNVLSEITHK